MMGYLQRMAVRAIQPRGRIHPMVGSIFSPAMHENTTPILAEESESQLLAPSERKHAALGPTHSTGVFRESLADRNEKAEASLTRNDVTETLAAAGDEFRPLLSSESRPTVVPSKSLRTESSERTNSSTQSTHANSAQLENASEASPRSEPYATVPQRQSSPELGIREIETHAVRGNQAFPIRRQERAPQQRAAPAPQEEIQINIGRIEVTAVSQAAVRPAGAPARKALNLDDYLKRRDGRAG